MGSGLISETWCSENVFFNILVRSLSLRMHKYSDNALCSHVFMSVNVSLIGATYCMSKKPVNL